MRSGSVPAIIAAVLLAAQGAARADINVGVTLSARSLRQPELPEEQRTAILLKEYHGLTFQEIADMLDCPLSTVKTRLYQGLSVLRRRLERRQAEAASLRRATWESSS